MYSFDSRIRYSETDSEGRLTMASLLNYFQDCSIFHSEDLGLGVGYLKERHLAWVLSSWQIVVERYALLGEKVKIATAPYEFKGFLGYRNFAMCSEDGSFLAKGNSLWSLLNTDTWKPAIPPQEMLEGYQPEPRLPMDYASRKIALPESTQAQKPIVVKKHHLDTNHHVNNGQYVMIAMEYLPESYRIRQMRAEYKKQAFLEDVLYPFVGLREGKYVIILRDAEERIYAVVEFM
ncbi:MAG: thioesterase [Roseburia sp.]|nr:thioesterase [Roseburia sp.]